MGLSLKSSAQRFSRDRFSVWDATTNTFEPKPSLTGKRFRIDRFTTIYHRPTRRSYIRLLDPAFPGVGVIRREGSGEIYLLSETLNTDTEMGRTRYEELRMSHLVMPPSGGQGTFTPVRTTGTGENLGPVDMTASFPVYLDLELQSAVNVEENIDAVTPRFLINHSSNVDPLHGDVFYFNGRSFIVSVPYVDGGLRIARVAELPPVYDTFTYRKRSGTGGYDPVTGTVTSGVTDLQFSGILGRIQKSDNQSQQTAPNKMELYVYEHHVGFQFEVGNSVLSNSVVYYINGVTRLREDKQWKVELSR